MSDDVQYGEWVPASQINTGVTLPGVFNMKADTEYNTDIEFNADHTMVRAVVRLVTPDKP